MDSHQAHPAGDDLDPAPRPAAGRHQDGERRPGRLRFVGALLATVLLAELIARALAPLLPPPNVGFPMEFERQLALVDAREGRIDTFIVGASEVAVGVDPAALAEQSDAVDAAHTVWMAGIGADTIAALTRDIAVRHHGAGRVIVGLTSREANASDADRSARDAALLDLVAYRDAAGSMRPLDHLDRAASDASALMRHRDRLRRPLQVVRDLRNGTMAVAPLEIDAFGMHTDRLNIPSYAESPGHYEQERQAMARYRLDTDALADLESVLREVREQGVEVVVVQLPVYERHYLALHPGLVESDAEFVAATRQLAERAGARYLDPRSTLDWDDPALWADMNHLNGSGTARLTAWLATQLDEA
jgi:hypothetical protein